MCAPAAPAILGDFHSESFAYQTLLVSIWELGEVIGPFLLASFSELYGRLPVYHCATILFIIFSVACATSTSLPMLITFRFLIGMTPPTGTLNSPIIADMFPKERRGRAISMVQLPSLIGTVIGPTVGSYLTEAKGWRWTFWLAAILCGAFECVFAIFYRETYRVKILRKRVERLRNKTGNSALSSKYDKGKTGRQVFYAAIIRPFRMLAFSPVILLIGLYVAVVYGYLFLILTTVGEAFEGTYHWAEKSVGLTYLGIGTPLLLASVSKSSTLNKLIIFFFCRYWYDDWYSLLSFDPRPLPPAPYLPRRLRQTRTPPSTYGARESYHSRRSLHVWLERCRPRPLYRAHNCHRRLRLRAHDDHDSGVDVSCRCFWHPCRVGGCGNQRAEVRHRSCVAASWAALI